VAATDVTPRLPDEIPVIVGWIIPVRRDEQTLALNRIQLDVQSQITNRGRDLVFDLDRERQDRSDYVSVVWALLTQGEVFARRRRGFRISRKAWLRFPEIRKTSVLEDLFDDVWLVKNAHDPHFPLALRAG
jgi:hypothetical protein